MASTAPFAALTADREEQKDEDEKKRPLQTHIALVYVLKLVFVVLSGA